MELNLRKQKILLGLKIFLTLTITIMVLIFIFTGSYKTWEALKNFKPIYLFIAFILIIVDLFSGALRIHIFTRKIQPQKSFIAAFNANLANIFLAAATPFQTGGGVAQLYVLNKYGIPYSAGLTVSILNFVATISMLFVAGSIIITTIPNRFVENRFLFIALDLSRVAFYFTLVLFFMFLFFPSIFSQIMNILFNFLSGKFPKLKNRFRLWNEKISDFIIQYKSHLSYYWKKEKMVLVFNYILTVILYFNKCVIAYVIFRSLGIMPDFWDVVMLQMLIVFFIYFAPTPGASFIAETSTSAIMSLIAPLYSISIFTVLWRFFTTYFGVILGSFVLIKKINEPKIHIERLDVKEQEELLKESLKI